jgi:hypothetical protein
MAGVPISDRADKMFGFDCVAKHERAWADAPSLHMGMLITSIRSLDLKNSSFDCKFILKKVWSLNKDRDIGQEGQAELRFLETNKIYSSLPGQSNLRSYKLPVLKARMSGEQTLNYNDLNIPDPSYMNAVSISIDTDLLFVQLEDTEVHFEQHTTAYGKFHEDYSLHHFPYDIQALHIEIRLRRRDIFRLKRHHLSASRPNISIFDTALSKKSNSSKDLQVLLPVVFHPRYYLFHWKTHRPITGINYVCKVLSSVQHTESGSAHREPTMFFMPQMTFTVLVQRAYQVHLHTSSGLTY